MKRLFVLLLALIGLMPFSNAQLPDNVDRICLTTIEGFLTVNQGAFQAAYQVQPNTNSQSVAAYYDYMYLARNDKNGMSLVFFNGRQVIHIKSVIRPFRIGCRWDDCVLVLKSFEENSSEIGYKMETIYAYGSLQNICDSILSLTEDGYVYKLRDAYFHSTYKQGETLAQTTQIVWPERRVYSETDDVLLPDGDRARLSEGDVYHYSFNRTRNHFHYYYLYRDKYMPSSVLIVDGKVVELFEEYNDEDIKFKFSYNGKHWMAVANDYFWVDGEMKYVGKYTITDFLISDNGDYFYKASKIGEEEKGETLVMNGRIIRRHVHIGHFDLDAQQHLRFHFFSNGQWYRYDNGQISNLAEESMAVFYADDTIGDLEVDMFSADGKHKLTYVNGKEGVTVDGTKVAESLPFQVVYDKNNNCFRWNAIEVNKESKTDLVLYRYRIPNNFIKNMFR